MVTMQEQQNNHEKRKDTKPQPAELSEQAIRNLVGFFDVLIQMDFAQKQRKERISDESISISAAVTAASSGAVQGSSLQSHKARDGGGKGEEKGRDK